MKAFLATARAGSFTAAAREIGVAPSVVTKRVRQLEWQLRSELLHRTTRSVTLTEIGERYMTSIQHIVTAYDELAAGVLRAPGEIEGHLRVKSPAAASEKLLARVFTEFQADHPHVTLEVMVMDRSVNPVEEGLDIAIGVQAASYDGVVEELLSRYPRVVCAAPRYIQAHGEPASPRGLLDHHCLQFVPMGRVWTFQAELGPISITIHPRFSTNDARLLLDVARAGVGIAVLSKLVAGQALSEGSLVPVLSGYGLPDLALRALVPESRVHLARVQALLGAIRDALSGVSEWEKVRAFG
jgi:DNA-binding transcriptional LysR family regulator